MLRHSLTNGGKMVTTPGGAEYNLACGLAQLGTTTRWVSALPRNEESSQIIQPAEARGVTCQLVDSQHNVGTYRVDQEANSVEYNRANSAFANLETGDIEWRGTLSGARWLVLSGITPLLSEGARTNWSQALTFAELDGILVALDVNHRPALAPFQQLWDILTPKLRQVHLLIISPEVLSTLTGGESPEHLGEMRKRWNLPYLGCTWKESGVDGVKRWSALAHANGVSHTRDRAVTHNPNDHLGGGDAWLAGLMNGMIDGLSLADCCHRGDLFAALTQATFGDLGEVTREDLAYWETQSGELRI